MNRNSSRESCNVDRNARVRARILDAQSERTLDLEWLAAYDDHRAGRFQEALTFTPVNVGDMSKTDPPGMPPMPGPRVVRRAGRAPRRAAAKRTASTASGEEPAPPRRYVAPPSRPDQSRIERLVDLLLAVLDCEVPQ